MTLHECLVVVYGALRPVFVMGLTYGALATVMAFVTSKERGGERWLYTLWMGVWSGILFPCITLGVNAMLGD